MITRCLRFASSAMIAALVALAAPATSAAFPDKQVTLLVGVAPGGSNDTVARLLAPKLQEIWGQPVVAENRTGAEGTLAASAVAKAAPDGYLLMLVTSSHTIKKSEVKIDYDPIESFSAITYIGVQPQLLVVPPNSPAKDVKEFIALAKAKPREFNFGSGGAGTPTFTAMALFMRQSGTDLVGVNYRGGAPTLTGMLAGEIHTMIGSISLLLDQVKAGKVRALGVTSKQRFPGLPDVPTISEAGNLPDYEAANWFGIVGPAKMPADLVAKMHADIVKAINSADVQAAFAGQGLVTVGGDPAAFRKMMIEDKARWDAF